MDRELPLHEFTYDLPAERIAPYPLAERDQSKLLVFRQGQIRHAAFTELPQYLPESSTLFFNNTRVIQARLHFEKKSGAIIEVFLLNPSSGTHILAAMQATGSARWSCAIGNLKRWKEGIVLTKSSGGTVLEARLISREEGEVEFRWNGTETFAQIIDTFGNTPLPPYLKRKPVADDKDRYQTVYSREEGAVAAPTAGLHFTQRVFDSLDKKGILRQYLTLHVSAGTFQPIKTDNAAAHTMHREEIVVSRESIESLLQSGKKIAVGTTSMRTMESLYWFGVRLARDPNAAFAINQQEAYTPGSEMKTEDALRKVLERMNRDGVDAITGETSIYIMPGYRFRVCQGLITNFHQPGSTLILLVAAFVGPAWRDVYDAALANGYRFLSYGDSSLLLPED